MRHFALVTAAVATLIAAPAFAAGVPATIAQQNAAINSVRVEAAPRTAVHRYKVSRHDFATQFNGTYKLRNGSEVALSSRGSRFYASLDGNEVELLSVTPNTFVSIDSKLAVSFDKDTTGGDDIYVRMN